MACKLGMKSRHATLCWYAVVVSLHLWVKAAARPGQWEQEVDEQGRKLQRMEIQAPTMTEEDQYGHIMPDRYRCDSCRAVVFHLNEALTRRQPKSRRLQEWERQEIFEETCKAGFTGYGIKSANGENVLSGPAFMQQEQPQLLPGMGAIQMGGESWERRLGEICRQLVFDEVGEDELYERFRVDGKLTDELCRTASRACRAPAAPTAPAPQKAKVKAERRSKSSGKKGDRDLDAGTFLASLAQQRGHPDVAAFTGRHDRKRWRELLLQAAEWLSEEHLEGGSNAQAIDV